MKTTILHIFIFLLVLFCSSGYKSQKKDSLYKKQNSEDFLKNIQDKIDHAFIISLSEKEDFQLLKILKQLNTMSSLNNNQLISYWQSYTNYFLSIYYLQQDNQKKAEKMVFEAIEQINNIPNKNSEDYALLAYEQSFSCQFRPGIVIPFVSKNLKKNCELAIQSDSLNLRAYFVMGSHDFYTPEMYGGGKITEKMLLTAISLPNQKIKNFYLPSWGKENAYELLIRWYIRKEKWQPAKKYYEEGLQAFPKSNLIKQLKTQIQ